MSKAIRVSETIYYAAKTTADAEHRSIPGQIEHWAMIGRAAMDNPDLPIDMVKELLITKNQPKSMAEPFVPRRARTACR